VPGKGKIEPGRLPAVIMPIPIRGAGTASGRRTIIHAAAPRIPGCFSSVAAARASGRAIMITSTAVSRLVSQLIISHKDGIYECLRALHRKDKAGEEDKDLEDEEDDSRCLQNTEPARVHRGLPEPCRQPVWGLGQGPDAGPARNNYDKGYKQERHGIEECLRRTVGSTELGKDIQRVHIRI